MITHTLNTVPKISQDIIVTNHCRKRFMERFHLYLTITEKQTPYLASRAIGNLVLKTGRINRKFEFSPFYRNKCASKYNQTVIIHTDVCVFIGKFDKGQLVLVTAVRRP